MNTKNHHNQHAIKALWVGGPPGKTLDNIAKNLLKEGIEIVERWDSTVDTMRNKHRIPTNIDVILLNHEMCNHPIQERIKQLSKKAHKPFILASLGTKRTILELKQKGILKNDRLSAYENNGIEAKKPDPDIVKEVAKLVDEKTVLLAQKRGIESRLLEIEIKLNQIKEDLGL